MKKFFSLIAAVLFAGSMFAAEVVGTINFGSASGSLNVNALSVKGNDSQDVEWTVTTTFDGETSFTPNSGWAQIGSAKKPAATITFTATLPAAQKIKNFEAKFGGFKDTAGDIVLKIGEEEVGSGALDASNDVVVSSTKEAEGTVLTVTVTNIAKGVKAYYISYSYEAEAPAVAKPAIAGEAFFYGETEVSITCSTEDAKIYYTLDGSEPTAEATEFAEAFKLNATTTVKAIAIKGEDKSGIAEKTFTLNPSFDSFEALVAAELENNTLVEVKFADVLIDSIYVSSKGVRKGVYFTVAEKVYEIYYSNGDVAVPEEWEAGAFVSGEIRGNWTVYYGQWELVPSAKDWTWAELTYKADEPVREWNEILFDREVAAADLPADAVFEFDGLKVAITDSENKMSIDGNKAYFGTEEVYEQYAFRLKTGGKSQDGNKKNFMNITVPADGELRIAVRTATSSDEARTLVLVQEGDTIYNQIVKDADAIEVAINDSTKVNVFPYVTVPVKAGEIAVGYPVGAINFYEFGFRIPPVVEATWTVAGSEAVFGSNWNPADANNDMIKQEDGSYLWEKENITLAAGNIEFKVCKDHAWKEAYPKDNYKLAISEAGVYRISIGFNAEAQTIAAIAQKTGEAQIDPTVSIAGSMNGWSTTADLMTLAEDKLSASLTLKNLAAGIYDFKVVLNGGEWRSNAQEFTRDSATALDITGNLDNMKLVADVDGDYSFIWLFEKNALAILYPSAAEADTIFLDVDYAEAMHLESYGAWQLNFYKDYDPATSQVTYPDLYIGVVEKSATALAGTYSADKELMFVQVYTSANDSAEAVAASDLEITYLGEGIYSVLFGFIGDDSNVYVLQGEFEFEAYEYGTWEEIELVEEQGIEEIMAESENGKAIKLMHEGQIYILKGNKLYNLSGQVVR